MHPQTAQSSHAHASLHPNIPSSLPSTSPTSLQQPHPATQPREPPHTMPLQMLRPLIEACPPQACPNILLFYPSPKLSSLSLSPSTETHSVQPSPTAVLKRTTTYPPSWTWPCGLAAQGSTPITSCSPPKPQATSTSSTRARPLAPTTRPPFIQASSPPPIAHLPATTYNLHSPNPTQWTQYSEKSSRMAS